MLLPSFLAAILPTIFLVWLIWLGDRYEREPTGLLIAAFVWGALPAIFVALLAELIAGAPFGTETLGDSLVQAAMIAPPVEELVKGLALLGLVRFARMEIDDTLDGIVYGALVGAGFAMTENFFYFLAAESARGLLWTVLLRAFVFGLNHIFYTAIFGAAVGYAVSVRNKGGARLIMLLGLMLAMMAHAFHNFSVTLAEQVPPLFLATLLMNWGGALVMGLIVLAAGRRERSVIRAYLESKEAAALTPADRRRLLSTLPPAERFIPNFPWLSQARQRQNRLYQYVAELAFRRRRLAKANEKDGERLRKEIAALQEKIDAVALARAKVDAGEQHQA